MDFDSRNAQIVELSIGDCIRLGNKVLTVVDIDGQEACFRVDAADELISIARAADPLAAQQPGLPR